MINNFTEPKTPVVYQNPCFPSPCGANSECREYDNRPVCSCLPGMLGAPPNCRPECLIHADCPTRLACLQSKCRDPCTGSCGFNAKCTVINHQPVCSCEPGYQGDPFNGCNVPGMFHYKKKHNGSLFFLISNIICNGDLFNSRTNSNSVKIILIIIILLTRYY